MTTEPMIDTHRGPKPLSSFKGQDLAVAINIYYGKQFDENIFLPLNREKYRSLAEEAVRLGLFALCSEELIAATQELEKFLRPENAPIDNTALEKVTDAHTRFYEARRACEHVSFLIVGLYLNR